MGSLPSDPIWPLPMIQSAFTFAAQRLPWGFTDPSFLLDQSYEGRLGLVSGLVHSKCPSDIAEWTGRTWQASEGPSRLSRAYFLCIPS